jgi:hypothetical protein
VSSRKPERLLPAQFLLQKLIRPQAVDHVRAVEVLDGGAVADEELVVEAADLGDGNDLRFYGRFT